MLLIKQCLKRKSKKILRLEPFLKVCNSTFLTKFLAIFFVQFQVVWDSFFSTFLLCGIFLRLEGFYWFLMLLSFISLLDPDYLAFVESLNKAEEPPPSIEAHLEEIEAKKCKYF